MKRTMRTNLMMGFTLVVSLILTACSSDQDETLVETEVVRPVKLITIESTDAINIRRFPAELKASEAADLAFRVGGQLMTLNVVAGQRVKKGELLASLDPTDFILQVELAQANQYLAEAQFKRIETMYRQNATTKSQFDSNKATLDQANNALQSAKNQMRYTQVFAPFDGVIAAVHTENFQYVSATQPLMHIQNIDQLDVEFQVPESIIANVQNTYSDYRANVMVDVAPDEALYGVYKEHNTTPDNATMAYRITLRLIRDEGKQHNLLPGMTANVDMDLSTILGTKQHITVPVEAVLRHEKIHTGQSSSTVWVFNRETGKVAARSVTLGALQGNQVEIISGLNAGEEIVAAGVSRLNESMPVRPWTRERGL
ncbi:MAG: efflux RND transporter periplasmic adaptor subunit [Methyloprofundus sp.]|nr:efflux RND transporter periplasmic adaptor subunit [Methyloprofundus sp.]